MSRVFIDCFEHQDLYLWNQVSVDAYIASTTGLDMKGDYCFNASGANGFLMNYLYTGGICGGVTEIYAAFQYRPKLDDSTVLGLYTLSSAGGTVIVRIELKSKVIKVYIGPDTANPIISIGSGTINLEKDTTYLIEIRAKTGDHPDGRIEIKVNGVSAYSWASGVSYGGIYEFGRVQIGAVFYSHGQAYFNNVVMDLDDWIGETGIIVLYPSGLGNSTNWNPSSGSNYACVDESPPVDTDYVSIDSVDITDTYALENVPSGIINTINCIQAQARHKKDGTPTPTGISPVIRSGGTDYTDQVFISDATWTSADSLWENNPADSGAWEESDINALEIGIKSGTYV